ncbi:DUF1145 domain-containing protein [Vibrio sonorensis]|uniref:DUF1145 domain-containing protein n=1 Tax=Vibrio sonorensis TaxID=1004316 RepID=UPI0008D9A58C|nr:DUF1145 domain-containing protein [Vibrio sonorensis]
MKIVIWLGKALFAGVWLVLLYNIIQPFAGNAAVALYIFTACLFFMHGIQMLMFVKVFGQKINMTTWEKWSILVFGVFSLLHIRNKYLKEENAT